MVFLGMTGMGADYRKIKARASLELAWCSSPHCMGKEAAHAQCLSSSTRICSLSAKFPFTDGQFVSEAPNRPETFVRQAARLGGRCQIGRVFDTHRPVGYMSVRTVPGVSSFAAAQ